LGVVKRADQHLPRPAWASGLAKRLFGPIDRLIASISDWIEAWIFGWPTQLVSRILDILDHVRIAMEGSWLRSVLSVTLFPLFMVLTLVIGFWLTDNGVTLKDFIAVLAMFSVYGLIFMPLERIMPWSLNWLKSEGDAAADLMLFFSKRLWGMWISQPVRVATVVIAVDAIGPAIGQSIWPSSWNPIVQVFLLLVVKDFFRYWFHRWMHEVPFLWRLHCVHHGVTRLYWFNGTRSHPLEGMVEGLLFAIPLAFVQAPIEVIFVSELLGRTIGRFQHTNIDVKLGFLDYIFSTPRNHRWHHSRSANEGDSNYGGDVIIWDHLFGTFYMPKDREPSDRIGIGSCPDFPKSWWGMMKAPFIYHRLPKIKYEEPGWRRDKQIKVRHRS
jgi:ornithine lipid hydroxylase